MDQSSVLKSQLADEEVRRELAESRVVQEAISELPRFDGDESIGRLESLESFESLGDPLETMDRISSGKTDLQQPDLLEAIIIRHGYPSLLIKNGDFEKPKLQVWTDRLSGHRNAIRQVISSVGRVELVNHPDAKWVGTCWLVDDQTLITNRHVAFEFTQAQNNRFRITPGVQAYVDFREEHLSDEELEYLISSVSFIEMLDRDIDLALMKIDPAAAQRLNLQPIPLANRHDQSEFIGVVGYPARDRRNPPQDMSRIFEDIYNVKRLAPGLVMNPRERDKVFTHNCTTLGGNSGSVVFDIASGCAIGLHFAGSALDANYAVNVDWLKDRLTKNHVRFSSESASPDGSEREEQGGTAAARDAFGDRDGYRSDFIGGGILQVPLPRLNEIQSRDVAVAKNGQRVLNYRHFSVVMSARRRLAYFSAVNIEGSDLRNPRRVGFKVDPRLERDQQADNDLYKHNDLDRGHLIRRLDPCWGTAEIARQANKDSNFFTNIGPQHKDLNQKLWLALEDHILDNTDDEDARISVFVGCVFDEDDPPHRETGIKVPMGFWKVVASATRSGNRRRSSRRRLQTQAFIFFQDHLVRPRDLGQELIFGGVEGVQQITVEELERITGLDFHVMRDADTFGLPPDVREQAVTESIDSGDPTRCRHLHYRLLNSTDDIL